LLAEDGQWPVVVAAWAPPFVAIGLALGFILRYEDG